MYHKQNSADMNEFATDCNLPSVSRKENCQRAFSSDIVCRMLIADAWRDTYILQLLMFGH